MLLEEDTCMSLLWCGIVEVPLFFRRLYLVVWCWYEER